MADGSVTIGVLLDTAAFSSSIAAVEGQISSLGTRINQSLSAAFSGATIDSSFVTALTNLASSIMETSSMVETALLSVATAGINSFLSAGWAEAGSGAAGVIAGGILSGGGAVTSAVQSIAQTAMSAFSSGAWSYVGTNMMMGVAEGIRAAGAEVIAAINEVSKQTETAVKEYYDIQSPSALMRDEVGVMISRGIAEGILSGSGFVHTALESVWPGTGQTRASDSTSSLAGGSVTQNIYLRDSDSSPYKTARRIKQESEAIFRN